MDPMVAPVCELRMSCVYVKDIEISSGGKSTGTFTTRVIREHMVPFLLEVEKMLESVGIAPIKLIEKEFYSADDQQILEKYPKRKGKRSKFTVPIVPIIGTYSVYTDIVNGEKQLYCKMDPFYEDGNPVHLLRSNRYNGVITIEDTIHSEMSLIREHLLKYRSMENHVMSAFSVMTNPPLHLQDVMTRHVMETDLHERANTELVDALDDLARPANREVERTDNMTSAIVYSEVSHGNIVDQADNARYLPRGKTVAQGIPQPTIQHNVIEEVRHMTENVIERTLKVPMNAVRSDMATSRYASAASLGDDKMRMSLIAMEIRDDMVNAFKQYWSIAHGSDDIEVHVPVRTAVTMDQLKLAFEMGALSSKSIHNIIVPMLDLGPYDVEPGIPTELPRAVDNSEEEL